MARRSKISPTEADYYYKVVVAALDNSSKMYSAPALINGFEFCMHIQMQEDQCEESVEDFVEPWDRKPSVIAARIKIMPQEVTYDGFCEDLTFHPFRQLAEHFPLGSMNRLRSAIYPYTQLYRLRLNCLMGIGPCEESNPYDFFFNRSATKGGVGRDYPSANFYEPTVY